MQAPTPTAIERVQRERDSMHLGRSRTISMYFDGLCEPRNPGGVATYGVVIKEGPVKVFEDGGLAFAEPWTDEASNNVAEYSAIIRGLKWLIDHHYENLPLRIFGDSRLIVNQLNGEFKIKSPRLVELYREAADLMSKFQDLKLEWVDRSKNAEADLLSRVAYARFLKQSKARKLNQE